MHWWKSTGIDILILGSIVATELNTFERTNDSFPKCHKILDEMRDDASTHLAIANLFAQSVSDRREVFCRDFSKRLQELKGSGLKPILYSEELVAGEVVLEDLFKESL